jgi:hypothetical protein
VKRQALLLGLCLLFNCSEQEVVAKFPALQASEDAVFVCREASGVGHPYTDCPDRDDTDDSDATKNLSVVALVSQTLSNEVALVDLKIGKVVDADRSTPGFGFLRVGGRPVSMATTPGGAATFVATAELGRNGIFALPTSCLSAPSANQPARDLTTWSACRLASAPGEIAVVVDGEAESSCQQPEYAREPNAHCPGAVNDATYDGGVAVSGEGGPVGRRKLIVSLPDLGQLAVLDAQNVLDARAGEFPDCQVEQYLPLSVDVPAGVTQTLPADLETTCAEVPPPTAAPADRRTPQPAGFALAENRLYVADQAAPVIHVIDTTASCALKELAPLLPMSLREPERVVTTRRVAVSPLTPKGKRYLYAIDGEDRPGGASVMAFDVSPDATDPTPIVRRGSPELPGEKPDRLALGSSARDITFAYRDLPYVDATGVAEFGALCDPNPALGSDEPGFLARPNGESTAGARPGLLRGLFGFVLLTDGRIGIVDVEDFDAPCRRPAQANTSEAPDFRGCANDTLTSFVLGDGKPTVTNEVSCRAVEEHRFRSARLAVNDAELGVRAPSLRSFPRLNLPASAANSAVEDRPRLLGVPFFNASSDPMSQPPATEVFVGSTRYSTDGSGEDLPVDPNNRDSELLQTLQSMVLPPLEPRAYAAEDTVSLTYEGSFSDGVSGFLSRDGSLRDPSLSFCGAGVYDLAAMADYAKAVLGLADEPAQAFAARHADYVQIISALPKEDDSYWRSKTTSQNPNPYRNCAMLFGPADAETLDAHRDFRIDQAFGDHLLLSARGEDGEVTVELAAECFPTAINYRLRTGRHWALVHASFGFFNHDVVESGADRACVRSCNPLKKWAKSRAFEISSQIDHCRPPQSDPSADATLDPLDQRVGCALPGEMACVFNQDEAAGVQLGGPGSKCIFEGLTERFALYRGREPSVRDTVFQWQTTGGFVPLVMSLSAVSSQVSPQSIQFLRQPEVMAVVDGSSLGLSLFSLDTFEVVEPSPYY